MTETWRILLIAATGPLAVGGCASPIDCETARRHAAEAGRDARWREAALVDIAPACHAAATDAWLASAAEGCAPVHAFSAARLGRQRPQACGDEALDEAWNLGEMLGALERERRDIERRLGAERLDPDTRRDLRQRRIVIDRDRPQLEGLARIRGLLPPAEVPGD